MKVAGIVNDITRMNFRNTFNPYTDACPEFDLKDAPNRRRDYLLQMLELAADAELDAVWVGRDLGYRGGRRTGLALTDDVNFSHHLERWGLPVDRPTSGEPVAERTAAVVWGLLQRIDVPVFLWNVFPLHPFVAGNPFTNRAHNAQERRAGIEILSKLLKVLAPKRVIAIGNDAYWAASSINLGCPVTKVRHPSYGGQVEFLESMESLYCPKPVAHQPSLFDARPN